MSTPWNPFPWNNPEGDVPVYPGSRVTVNQAERCLGKARAMLYRGLITHEQYRDYSIRLFDELRAGAQKCPPLPRPSQPINGPIHPMRPVNRIPPNLEPSPRIGRWPPIPPYPPPETGSIGNRSILPGIGPLVIDELLQQLLSNASTPSGCNDAIASMIGITTEARRMLRQVRERLQSLRQRLAAVGTGCPTMTQACRNQLNTLFNRLAACIAVLDDRIRTGERFHQEIANAQCTPYWSGSNHSLIRRLGQIISEIVALANDSLNTLALWEKAAATFAKDCGCKQSPWDPIEPEDEGFFRHSDKFLGGSSDNE